MNYKIVTNEKALREFIDFLPDLENGECFYVALFCRSKYSDKLKKDKLQLKRITSSKEFLFDKIKQMECELGTYKYNGEPIPVEAMCLYITPNPRNMEKAGKKLALELVKLGFNEYNGYNPQAEALTAIQESRSRTVFMHFDFDNTTIDEMKDDILKFINESAITFVQTHGGFHLLIKVESIDPKYFKTYYNNIVKLPNCDKRGDAAGLLPVVGCCQGGGFSPSLFRMNVN